MIVGDFVRFALESVAAYRVRSALTALGIAVGIASVVLLTSIGEGVHRFVLGEFTQFGTHLIAVAPGRSETFGFSGAMVNSVRPLSLEDAEALGRLPGIEAVVPLIQGNAAIERGGRSRRSAVFGVSSAVPAVWNMHPVSGHFLPEEDPRYARPLVVLGSKVRSELFGSENPLGVRVRVGGESYRVVGVMEPKGQMLGFDLDDAVYIPTHRAMSLFNEEGLMEVDLLYRPGGNSERLASRVGDLLKRRHGAEDFTIITQDQMLETLGGILGVLTLAVGALGGISLLVGAIGILTIMTISVNERKGEVGLLRAIGAGRGQILALFLCEAIVLSGLGGAVGLCVGVGGALLLNLAIPALPVQVSLFYLLLAVAASLGIGLVAGVAPAWRAARLDPVEALRDE